MLALIIDDSRAMRAILRKTLKHMGFEIVEAGNGQEGLDQLNARGPFELALVDWNMPVMNGLDFVKAARCQAEHSAMRIVMVTTEVEMSQVALALGAGADEYIMKPFTDEILRDKLGMLGLCAA